jgi:ATPase subunit of ABC transporter with duplicated ATPase domains
LIATLIFVSILNSKMSLAEELLADLEEENEYQQDEELKEMIEESAIKQELIDQEMRDLSGADAKPANLLKISNNTFAKLHLC